MREESVVMVIVMVVMVVGVTDGTAYQWIFLSTGAWAWCLQTTWNTHTDTLSIHHFTQRKTWSNIVINNKNYIIYNNSNNNDNPNHFKSSNNNISNFFTTAFKTVPSLHPNEQHTSDSRQKRQGLHNINRLQTILMYKHSETDSKQRNGVKISL